jgi:regulator of nucleoside diphosphate kinase
LSLNSRHNGASISHPDCRSLSGWHSPVYVTTEDRSRLLARLMSRHCPVDRTLRRAMLQKLWFATTCGSEAVPADVVTMNSRVVFCPHFGQPSEERTLRYGDASGLDNNTLSVWTRLGIAILGLRGGCRMRYEITEGEWRLLFIEAVRYQPEAAGRHASTPFQRWIAPRRQDRPAQDRAYGPPAKTSGTTPAS